MYRKRGHKKRGHKRRGRGKRGIKIPRSRLGLMPSTQNRNYAKITETTDKGTFDSNTTYFSQFSILDFPRAIKMCQMFKFYRCKAIVYDYMPEAINFQASSTAVSTTVETPPIVTNTTTNGQDVPYFFYNMNRDGATNSFQNNSTGLSLKEAGARTIKFNKKIVISYKPNLAQVVNYAQQSGNAVAPISQGSTPVYSKWISTNGIGMPTQANTSFPNNATIQGQGGTWTSGNNFNFSTLNAPNYYGHDWFCEQLKSANSTVGWYTVTCIWEFKEPVLQNFSNVPRVDP